MTKKRKISSILVGLLLSSTLSVAEIHAATQQAVSCSYQHVSGAVAAANPGDTVIVPPGSCTWSSQLSIGKSITLTGAGAGQTIITGNIGHDYTDNTFLLKVTPDASNVFHLSGFTFDLNSNSKGIKVINSTTTPVQIRINSNSVLNCIDGSYVGLEINGTVLGVIDSNTFTGYPHFDIYGIGAGGLNSWNSLTIDYGAANALYIEDNTIYHNKDSGSGWAYTTNGHGGRVVWRYNSLISTLDPWGIFPVFDIHGNQPSGVYAGMLGEYYGNYISASDIINDRSIELHHHRGGKSLMFFNSISSNTSGSHYISNEEEYDDIISPTSNLCTDGKYSCNVQGVPQHVSDSYYWSNLKGSTSVTCSVTNDIRTPPLYYTIAQGVDFFFKHSSTAFDGTNKTNAGVGCGALAARPATCSTGVGYWATSQSCSDLTGMVGASPSTPISGTLYKCTATNTWKAYYTPYTYPHPLRNEVAPPVNLHIKQ
jgi:hypothetical protein